MPKSPIVKLRYERTHFYLGTFPKNMAELIEQTKSKLLPRKIIEETTELKYQYCDPWNDMVEIQNDSDVLTMGIQSSDKSLVLIEVSRIKKQRQTNWNYDLKGFISSLKEIAPDLGTHFNFIMEEGDQIPCEDCFGKGVLTRNGKKLTCQNCSGCGARPLSAFWELLMKVIDYKMNQRIFDHLSNYLAGWNTDENQDAEMLIKPQLLSGISFNTYGQNQKEQYPTFNVQSSENEQKNIKSLKTKQVPSFPEKTKARLSLGRAPLGFNEKISSSVENSDGEHSLIKQSPLIVNKQATLGVFQYGFGGGHGGNNQGYSTMSSSGLWPVSQAKGIVPVSPKPSLCHSTEGRVRSITGKLQAFSGIDLDKPIGEQRIPSDDEPKTTKKEIKFTWMGGSKEVTLDPENPQLRLILKNINTFSWGPGISFILKSPNIKKSLPLEKEVHPGEVVDITITNLLEGIGEEVLVIQLKGVDEKTYTKYTSERLELSVKLSK